MTVLMSGINMYSMALVMKVVLGWNLNFSIWVSSITVALYVGLGGLRSAIYNEVLQFLLIWLGALLVPILGLIEAGGWTNLKHQIGARLGSEYVHLWSTTGHFSQNPMGIHWTGLVFGLALVISCGYWTTDFLVVQRVLSAQQPAVGADGSDYRRGIQDGGAVHRDPAGVACAGRCFPITWWVRRRRLRRASTATTKCCR